MNVTVKSYFLPQSLDEALGLLAEHGDSLMLVGGGTVAMPLINEGVSTPEKVMALRQSGLNYVRRSNGIANIGATTTLTQMVNEAPFPLLQEVARQSASWTIRNMATVGGNLFVPPPSGDFATALLSLDAQVKLASQAGQRLVPLVDFYSGFMANVMRPDEILAEIQVPAPKGKTAFIKYGRKTANTPAVVTVAAHITWDGDTVTAARLALNAVGPHPIRATAAEEILTGNTLEETTITAAATSAAEQCEPFTDAVASEWYRRKMVKVFAGRLLRQIAGEEG
jgi:CO/xanthine dehydrogenase FAD-binding subunit